MSALDASLLVPALAIALGLIATVLYRLIRPRFNVTVTCWFCHQQSVVPYENRNCWDCLRCEQYNGFLIDGGYNKDIPAQHIEELNHPVIACERELDSNVVLGNGLCETCNRNQQLKVCQLANFVPYDEANFDIEVASYSKHLEDVYQLCDRCSAHVDTVLRQQNAVLSTRLLNERLRKTASEHSYSSTSRSHSGTRGSCRRVLPNEQSSTRRSLAAALNCLAAVCGAAAALCFGLYLAPGSSAATSLDEISDRLSPLVLTILSRVRAAGLPIPDPLPFAFDDLITLFIFTGFAAELVALALRSFQRPAGAQLLVNLAWCALLASSLCMPSADVGSVGAAAVQLLCAAIAVVAAIAGCRYHSTGTRASYVAKARRMDRYSPSSSGFDSATSDGRTCRRGLASPSGSCGSRSVAFGSSGRRVAYSNASGGAPSETQQQPSPPAMFDVGSSLSRLRLDASAIAAASAAERRRSHMLSPGAAKRTSSSVGSFRLASTEPVIKPGRMMMASAAAAAAATTRTGRAQSAVMSSSESVRSIHTATPSLRRLSGSPTVRGSSASVLSGRLCNNLSPENSFCEDSTFSWYNGSCGSYHTVGFSPSIADQVFRGTVASNGLSHTSQKGDASPTTASATKPLFVKAAIVISVGLNAAVFFLLARQQQIL